MHEARKFFRHEINRFLLQLCVLRPTHRNKLPEITFLCAATDLMRSREECMSQAKKQRAGPAACFSLQLIVTGHKADWSRSRGRATAGSCRAAWTLFLASRQVQTARYRSNSQHEQERERAASSPHSCAAANPRTTREALQLPTISSTFEPYMHTCPPPLAVAPLPPHLPPRPASTSTNARSTLRP